jgi:hypothetical protein
LVDDITERSNDLAEQFAAFAMRLKCPGAGKASTGCALKQLNLFAWVPGLTVSFVQQRFVIKRVDVACCASHEQLNDSFCAWPVMELPVEDTFFGHQVG